MSFFVTERFNAVMLADAAHKGGRAAPQQMTSPMHLAISSFDGCPPARPGPGDHREKASSKHLPSSVTKKDIHAHEQVNFKELKCYNC
jgi:hypothetical protein